MMKGPLPLALLGLHLRLILRGSLLSQFKFLPRKIFLFSVARLYRHWPSPSVEYISTALRLSARGFFTALPPCGSSCEAMM